MSKPLVYLSHFLFVFCPISSLPFDLQLQRLAIPFSSLFHTLSSPFRLAFFCVFFLIGYVVSFSFIYFFFLMKIDTFFYLSTIYSYLYSFKIDFVESDGDDDATLVHRKVAESFHLEAQFVNDLIGENDSDADDYEE